MAEKFWVESPVRLYGIESGEPSLYSETIGELHFSEKFIAKDDCKIPECVGEYSVVIEAMANNFDDLKRKTELAKEAAELLDKLWIYPTSYPITVTDFSKFQMRVVEPIPEAWSTNYDEVEKSVSNRQSLMYGKVSISGGSSWIVFDKFPLEYACRALSKYDGLNEAEKYLIDLQHLYLTTDHRPSPIFLLAKAMEIVESLVPGKTRKDKSCYVDDMLGKKLPLDLGDLLKIANTSREIRHAIRKKASEPELHPNVGQEMITEFAKNSNNIIRCIVCNRIDIPFHFLEQK